MGAMLLAARILPDVDHGHMTPDPATAVTRHEQRALCEALDFVGLAGSEHRIVGDLSQEEKKRLAFALALATEPRIVLLDEPAGGVNQ